MKRHHLLLMIFLIVLSCSFFKTSTASPQELGAVATQQPLATQTAIRILKQGGNAIDAAIAAALTLSVVEPHNSGLGAGGMALVWVAGEKKAHAVDFREQAPSTAQADMYLQPGIMPDASRNGPLAIAVPGELAGLAQIHRNWGHLPWKQLFQDAIRYAREGFEPDPILLQRIQSRRTCLLRDYDSYKIYRPFFQRGTLPSVSPSPEPQAPQRLIQKKLSETLLKVSQQGPKIFYGGDLGRQLLGGLQGKGVMISQQDLVMYQVKERKALEEKYSWGQIWAMPLPSSGGISIIRGLNTLSELMKKEPKQFEQRWVAWLIPTLDNIFASRNEQMGDPDFAQEQPVRKWLSKGLAKQDAKTILENPPFSFQPKPPDPSPGANSKTDGHTTHLSVMDVQGNAVSLTLTLNLPFGSCVTAGDTGIMMNNQMDDFSTKPGRPNAFGLVQSQANAIAPGKRPLSSMSPTLVTEKHRPILAIGSPGGPRIITSILEVLLRYFLLEEPLEKSVAAGRIHFQGMPKKIYLESALNPKEKRQLEQVELPRNTTLPWGNVQAVSYDPTTQSFRAVSDPRGVGRAEVVYR